MELLTDEVKPVQDDAEASVFVVGHEEIKPDEENGVGVELATGDAKPSQGDVDASAGPAGGGE